MKNFLLGFNGITVFLFCVAFGIYLFIEIGAKCDFVKDSMFFPIGILTGMFVIALTCILIFS